MSLIRSAEVWKNHVADVFRTISIINNILYCLGGCGANDAFYRGVRPSVASVDYCPANVFAKKLLLVPRLTKNCCFIIVYHNYIFAEFFISSGDRGEEIILILRLRIYLNTQNIMLLPRCSTINILSMWSMAACCYKNRIHKSTAS